MSRFASVGLPISPEEGGSAASRASLEAWVRSKPFTTVVQAFGGPMPGDDLDTTLRALDAFSAEHWDFRDGQERNLARKAEFDDATTDLVLRAAEALGLRTDLRPRREHYDHVLILGGLVRACVLRPQLAHELMTHGISAGEVTGLGAFRPLRGDELELARHAGIPDATNEVEAMTAGIRAAFGLGEPTHVEGDGDAPNANERWLVARFDASPPVLVVAAPTTDPTRRANTADTYAYWARHIAELDRSRGATVLLVTSAIYVPYQHADAVRMLAMPFGAVVDTVGVDPRRTTDEVFRQTFTAPQYLQEFRSTIRAFHNLLNALEESTS